MSRKITKKELKNSRILKEYASWIYCEQCSKTVAYLCYLNYNNVLLNFVCRCGNVGKVEISLETNIDEFNQCEEKLLHIKNRFLCPIDNIPLFSFVGKNIEKAGCFISCECCSNSYYEEIITNK